VLGHLVRGGTPTSSDRLLGLEFGAAAVRGLADNLHGVMVALHPPDVRFVPIKQAIKRRKTVPPEGSTVSTARAMDIFSATESLGRQQGVAGRGEMRACARPDSCAERYVSSSRPSRS
jgi:ATP-dependent phosphofructokinase / diphosphate-dependent phosphofructokinase